MIRIKLREFFRGEAPQIDYELLKAKIFKKINAYHAKREGGALWLMPKVCLHLLLLLLIVNVYSLLQEVVYSTHIFSDGIRVSAFISLRVFMAAVDNLIAIGLATFIIFLIDKRFLSIFKLIRLVRGQLTYAWGILSRLPSAAWGILRRS